MSWEVIIVAVISFLGNALATWMSNNKTQALLSYRLEQLEKKQDKHNNVIERTYAIEKELATVNVRIGDLEAEVKKHE